jgi:folate-binding protein YgfZ
MEELKRLRFNSYQIHLTLWSLIKVTGKDREKFIQNQTTNDLRLISNGQSQITCRLDRAGKVQFYFYVSKSEDELIILCESVLQEKIMEEFQKYIIMDDVDLSLQKNEVWLYVNSFIENETTDSIFEINFHGVPSLIGIKKLSNLNIVHEDEITDLRILNGFPQWGKTVSHNSFINETYLNVIGISYKKGCFLGQETAAKIENNRGAAYSLMIINSDKNLKSFKYNDELNILDQKVGSLIYIKDHLAVARLSRELRVVGKKVSFTCDQKIINGTIQGLPYFQNQSRNELAEELYLEAVDLFQKNQVSDSLSLLKLSLKFNPLMSQSFESIGVILGRNAEYEEAINWMDKLLAVEPTSVMAHTNKSLYLMKLGKIEEAEAEKALATVKSFASFGEEAKIKKHLEEEKKKKEADLLRRESMFKQVLEIDSSDTVALYGMSDILFYRGLFHEAQQHLEQVLKTDEQYSVAYLLLGKCLESQKLNQDAMRIYEKGIMISTKRGDMMPANEMQSRLNQIVVSSRKL